MWGRLLGERTGHKKRHPERPEKSFYPSVFTAYITPIFLVVTFAFLVVTEFFLVVTEIHLAFT